jgi:hypothetical protein
LLYLRHPQQFIAFLFQAYEHEVRSRGPAVTHEMDALLKTLRRSGDEGYDTDGGFGSATSTSKSSSAAPTATPTKTKVGLCFIMCWLRFVTGDQCECLMLGLMDDTVLAYHIFLS